MKMKLRISSFVLSAALLAAPWQATAQTLNPTVAADVVTTYMFRGVDVSHAPALQPWATVALGSTGLSATAWGSFAFSDRDHVLPYSSSLTAGGADEIDLIAAYARTSGPVSYGLGYIAYLFPASQLDYTTQELYGTLGLAVPFAPTLSVYYDFDGTDELDLVEGVYASLGAARSIPVGLPLDIGASVGWTDQEALRPDPGFHDLNLSVGVPIPVSGLLLTPSVGYTHLLHGSAYIVRGETRDDKLWAKVQVKLP
jgi:hypothetical protein